MDKVKTILMWYSGFVLFAILAIGIMTIQDTTCVEKSFAINLGSLLFFLPIAIYIFWQIADSLNGKK